MASSLVFASAARADYVTFDPDGPGGIAPFAINLLDPAPGNVLTIGAGGASAPAPGKTVEALFQANISTADDTAIPGTSWANGQGGVYYTVVAGIPATIDSITLIGGGPNSVVQFDITGGTPVAPTANNFFYIYETTSAAQVTNNDLSGNCFTCGTLVLSGVFIDDNNFTNSFTTNIANSGKPLDGFGTDNYSTNPSDPLAPTITSIAGTGGLNAHIQVTYADPLHFSNIVGTQLDLITAQTQSNAPFTNADPSACFSRTGLASCTYGGAGTGNVGPVNGEGFDVQLESDASFGFRVIQAQVPEPATLTLLGLGLAGAAARRRRARKIEA